MKRKIFSLVFALLLILPCAFMMSACGDSRVVSVDNSFKQNNILNIGLVEKNEEGLYDFDNIKTFYTCEEDGTVINDVKLSVNWKTENVYLCVLLNEGYCLAKTTGDHNFVVEHSNGDIKQNNLRKIKYEGHPTYYVSMMPILGYDCDYLLKLNATIVKEQKEISFINASYNLDPSFTNARFKIALNNEYYKVEDETKVFTITEFAEFLNNSFEEKMTVDGKVDYDSTLKIEVYFVDGNGNVDDSKILKYNDYSKGLFEINYTDEFGTEQTHSIFPTSDPITGEILRENGAYAFEILIITDTTIELNWEVYDDTIETIESEEIWNKALGLHTYEQVKYVNTSNGTTTIKYGDILYTENEGFYSFVVKDGQNYFAYTSSDNLNWTKETITELEYMQTLNLLDYSLLFEFENFQYTSFVNSSTGITTSYYENKSTIVHNGDEYTNVKLNFENNRVIGMSFTIAYSEHESTEAVIEIIYNNVEIDELPNV